jgi:hypothetical protein
VKLGAVHKALRLNNRVQRVCAALSSKKFLTENRAELVSRTGPSSGQSTAVTFTYEFITNEIKAKEIDRLDARSQLRTALKDVFAELDGRENYLRNERANFHGPGKYR